MPSNHRSSRSPSTTCGSRRRLAKTSSTCRGFLIRCGRSTDEPAAKRATQTLDATLVDDNRRPLTDASLGAIRQQVEATVAARAGDSPPAASRWRCSA
jgi:hypothetical protein